MSKAQRIAVIGGGISGLSCACFLKSKGKDVTLFESQESLGGYAGTLFHDDLVVERGPNGFLDNEPATRELVDLLGLSSKIVISSDKAKIRYIYKNGKLNKVPAGPKDLFTTELLSWSGRLGFVKDLIKPLSKKRTSEDESVFDFAKRHFGFEIAENLVRPAMLGIFAGEAKDLSVEEALPKLFELDREYGSIFRGMRISARKRPKKSKGMGKLFTLQGGLGTLVGRAEELIGNSLRLETKVVGVKKLGNPGPSWEVQFKNDQSEAIQTEVFTDLVVSLSPDQIGELFGEHLSKGSVKALDHQLMAPMVNVALSYDADQGIRGYGAIVARTEGLNSLGILHPKDIFEGHVPEGKDLFTILMGGAFHPTFHTKTDTEISEVALQELETVLGISDRPSNIWITRHLPGIPQYEISTIEGRKAIFNDFSGLQNIYLNGHIHGGVSMNDCIRKSKDLASRL